MINYYALYLYSALALRIEVRFMVRISGIIFSRLGLGLGSLLVHMFYEKSTSFSVYNLTVKL